MQTDFDAILGAMVEAFAQEQKRTRVEIAAEMGESMERIQKRAARFAEMPGRKGGPDQ